MARRYSNFPVHVDNALEKVHGKHINNIQEDINLNQVNIFFSKVKKVEFTKEEHLINMEMYIYIGIVPQRNLTPAENFQIILMKS